MALVIKGRVVPLTSVKSVAADPLAVFAGRVWIGADGLIAAVTKGNRGGPPGFDGAQIVDVGPSLVFPGLVDLHNHLAYNTLPLWTEPTRTTPFPHHDSWPAAASYAASVTWPAYALITAAPAELLAYVETKAIIGGTTSIQGSPPKNRPLNGWMVRNIEDETFGAAGGANKVYASVLTLKSDELADRAARMRAGSTFIYHCAEGQPGSLVAREFDSARTAGCLQERFIAIHCSAVESVALHRWTAPGAIVWSPFSNLWLYGTTTDIPAAIDADIPICLGSDWQPSGTKHVLGELKVARLVADHLDWKLADSDLVQMVTSNPGDALARSWHRPVGRLQPGAIGDVMVVAAPTSRADPFATLVAATERDIELVVIDGNARYGKPGLMRAAKAKPSVPITIAGQRRALALTKPDDATAPWPWTSVVDRLEEVRANPKAAIKKAQQGLAAWAGRLDQPDAPLRLALDMPTGRAPVGGLPKDLGAVVVPPLDSLTHDHAFVASIEHRGFHQGILDGLADYYP